MGKRIYSIKPIRYCYSYDIDEVAKLCGVHVQTVREWIKNGLPKIDSRKPVLIYGAQLRKFLKKLNLSSKCATAFDQMFCMKCRDAKTPYRRTISVEQKENSYVKAKALCRDCKTVINKTYKLTDFPRLRSIFHVGDISQLIDGEISPVNTHLPMHAGTARSEPVQLELF